MFLKVNLVAIFKYGKFKYGFLLVGRVATKMSWVDFLKIICTPTNINGVKGLKKLFSYKY